MIERLEQDLALYRQALRLRNERHALLAANVANADTPHYKARDLDFKAALQTALGARAAPTVASVELARSHPAHFAGKPAPAHGGAVKYRVEYQGAVDGNTVNMDVERAALAENALQLEALLMLVNRRFESLQRAIQGQ